MDGFENLSLGATSLTNRPPASRRRVGGRILSLLACIGLPVLFTALYEYGFAADQYVVTEKFIVREQAPQMASPGSLSSALAGGNPMLALIEDSEVVVQYIKSGQMLRDLPPGLSLDAIYATKQADRLARLHAHLPPERQLPYWRTMVQPSFDISSGIITVQVRAFTPQDSALVAQTVLSASEILVDRMSQTARHNALSYAAATAQDAQAALANDEAALATYRNRYALLFPEMNAQQNSTVGGNLQLGLAQDRANLAALRAQGQADSSPQVRTLLTRITAGQAQMDALTAQLAAQGGGAKVAPLATLLTGYDKLMETEKLDEQLYAADLENLQNARNTAAERSLYLESFVQPTVPQASTYPVRWLVTVEIAVAGFIGWILGMLTLNMVRDQLD